MKFLAVFAVVVVATVNAAQKDSSLGCFLCSTVVNVAKQYADKEEPVVKQKLEAECQKMGSFASACKQLVDDYLPIIYKYLDQDLTPQEICTAIGLCKSGLKSQATRPTNQENIGCILCKTIVSAAKAFADSEEPEVEALMDKFCDKLGEYKDACKAAVKEIIPLVYKYLDSDLNPEEICQEIDLCPKKVAAMRLVAQPTNLEDTGCELCKMIVSTAKMFLDKEEPEVEKLLDGVCDKLGQYSDECKQLVKEYLPVIFKYLDGELNPEQICQEIKLCPSKAKPKHRLPPKQQLNDVSCDICKTLVEVAKQYADEEEPEVKKKLDAECKHLGFLSGFCKDLVNKYIDQIYQYLNTGLSDTQICQKIDLCK